MEKDLRAGLVVSSVCKKPVTIWLISILLVCYLLFIQSLYSPWKTTNKMGRSLGSGIYKN